MNSNTLLLIASCVLAAGLPALGQAIVPNTNDAATKFASRPYAKAAIAHYNHGVELHRSGFLNQAIVEYKAALEADDRLDPAWSNLGGIYAAQKMYSDAITSFEKALALNPKRSTTLDNYASVLYALGRNQEAIKKWQQAIDADAANKCAFSNLANALDQSGHHDEAQAVRERGGLLPMKILEPSVNCTAS